MFISDDDMILMFLVLIQFGLLDEFGINCIQQTGGSANTSNARYQVNTNVSVFVRLSSTAMKS